MSSLWTVAEEGLQERLLSVRSELTELERGGKFAGQVTQSQVSGVGFDV